MIERLPSLPIPEPGETVYSLFCRLAERSGVSARWLLGELTGNSAHRLATALPSHVLPIASKMPAGHPWRDAGLIVAKHTTLPYFLYCTPDVREQWIEKFAGCGPSYYLQSGIGLAAYPCPPAPRHPRYCPLCVEDDLHNLGYSYYRREHQLPGVMVCRTHGGILLNDCAISGHDSLAGQVFRMAGRCLSDAIKPLPVVSDPPADLEPLLWLARESAVIVDSSGTRCGNFPAILKNKAVKAGLRYMHGIDHAGFARAIESRFGRDTLRLLGIPAWRGNAPAPWVTTLMYSPRRIRKSTIHRLLAIGTLFGSVEEFERSADEGRNGRDGESGSGRRTEAPEWAESLPELLGTPSLNISEIARRLGTTYLTILFEARRQGLHIPLSQVMKNKFGDEKLNAVRRDMREGMGIEEACRLHGMNRWTILRIELDDTSLTAMNRQAKQNRRREKHRQALLNFLADNPEASRKLICRHPQLRISRFFLMKFDREWLLSHLPEGRKRGPRKGPRATRIDWESIDRTKAGELERAVEAMQAEDGGLAWLSKARLLAIVDVKDQYRRYPHRLPLIGEIIRRRAETRTQHETRKLEWAVSELARRGEKLSLKSLHHIAGMKRDSIRKHVILIADLTERFNVEIDVQSVFRSVMIRAGKRSAGSGHQ